MEEEEIYYRPVEDKEVGQKDIHLMSSSYFIICWCKDHNESYDPHFKKGPSDPPDLNIIFPHNCKLTDKTNLFFH